MRHRTALGEAPHMYAESLMTWLLLALSGGNVVYPSQDPESDNSPPRILTDFVQTAPTYVETLLDFEVRAADPDGDLVTLRLLNPPPALVFDPVEAGESPVVGRVRWWIPIPSAGIHHLVFEAFDDVHSERRSRLTVTLRVTGGVPSYLAYSPGLGVLGGNLVGDVTGDGILDVVAVARMADVGGVPDAGALYVWAGATDGGGSPTATLTVPNAGSGEQLGTVTGASVHLDDVTGDGVLDVVVGSANAPDSGSPDRRAGSVYVWNGGKELTGRRPPDSRLVPPASPPSYRMGIASLFGAQGLMTVDVTGDRVSDVVAIGTLFPVDSKTGHGAAFVWRGGARDGVREPDAVLTTADPEDSFLNGLGQLLQVADITGDGVRDLVAVAPAASPNGVEGEGAIYVWEGQAGLEGWPAPTAVLSSSSASLFEGLGDGMRQSTVFGDITGDGILDVVARGPNATVGNALSAGVIYVFEGGSGLRGSVFPKARLLDPKARSGDQLGYTASTFYSRRGSYGVRTADVTGDGHTDVIAGVRYRNSAGKKDAGAIFVFSGGPNVQGDVFPHAKLVEKLAKAGHELGSFELADVTGNGLVDVVAGTPLTDVAGKEESGAVYIWEGGTQLAGKPTPAATLIEPLGKKGQQVGNYYDLGDFTGDAVLDVVLHEPYHGPFLVWSAVSAQGLTTPTARLREPYTGNPIGDPRGQGFFVVDVTGDGVGDLITGGVNSAPAGVSGSGGFYVWKGGILGAKKVHASLHVSSANPTDFLGAATGGEALQFADLDGDGVLDIVGAGSYVNVQGVPNAGAAYAWRGGPSLIGLVPETWSFEPPSPGPGDRLGTVTGHGFQLADLDGDGLPDFLAGTGLADVNGTQDVGVMYRWTSLVAATAFRQLFVPEAQPGDRLGL